MIYYQLYKFLIECTDDEINYLISAYENQPCLYDSSWKSHKQVMKAKTWQEVAG